jgi:hypothetical protein
VVQPWTSIQKKEEEEGGYKLVASLNLISCPYGFTMSHCFADILATGDCLVHNLIDVG